MRTRGKCECGRRVDIIEDDCGICRDRRRMVYPERQADGSCIFRCEDCLRVIRECWRPLRGQTYDVEALRAYS